MPVNRWALLEEYFKWFQAGLIDDIAMVSETDIRNKKQLLKRKSVYSQLQSQVQGMEGQLKDLTGENETLKRQLVQAGIKGQVDKAAVETRKDLLETEAEQKLLRGMLRSEFESMRKDMKREYEASKEKLKDKDGSVDKE